MMTATLPPWLLRREGEDDDTWFSRKARSCWYCPIEPFPNFGMADQHEIECGRARPEDRLQYTRSPNRKAKQ